MALRAQGSLSQDVEDEYRVVRRQRTAALTDYGGRSDAALNAHVLERRHHVVGVVLYRVVQASRRVRRCALEVQSVSVCGIESSTSGANAIQYGSVGLQD